MKSAFGMFILTKREQRVVVIFMLALATFVLAKHYRDTGAILPARAMPSPTTSATPSPSSDEDRADTDEAR